MNVISLKQREYFNKFLLSWRADTSILTQLLVRFVAISNGIIIVAIFDEIVSVVKAFSY